MLAILTIIIATAPAGAVGARCRWFAKFAAEKKAYVEFESYQHPDLVTRQKINKLDFQLIDRLIELEALKKEMPRDNERLRKAITATVDVTSRLLRAKGFVVKKTERPDVIELTKLPEGHPASRMFTNARRKLGTKFNLDMTEYLDGATGGTQEGAEIYLESFIWGQFNRKIALHEIGHRSSELRSATNPLELYNFTTFTLNSSRASKVVKLGPGLYGSGMNGDELKQHLKDLKRLKGKSGVLFAADEKQLQTDIRESLKKVRAIAEAVQSQSAYALRKLDESPESIVTMNSSSMVQIPVQDPKTKTPLVMLEYNLSAFSLPDSAKAKAFTSLGKTDSNREAAARREFALTKLRELLMHYQKESEEALRYLDESSASARTPPAH